MEMCVLLAKLYNGLDVQPGGLFLSYESLWGIVLFFKEMSGTMALEPEVLDENVCATRQIL